MSFSIVDPGYGSLYSVRKDTRSGSVLSSLCNLSTNRVSIQCYWDTPPKSVQVEPRPESINSVTEDSRPGSVFSLQWNHDPCHYTVVKGTPVLDLFSPLSVVDLRPVSLYSVMGDTRFWSIFFCHCSTSEDVRPGTVLSM